MGTVAMGKRRPIYQKVKKNHIRGDFHRHLGSEFHDLFKPFRFTAWRQFTLAEPAWKLYLKRDYSLKTSTYTVHIVGSRISDVTYTNIL